MSELQLVKDGDLTAAIQAAALARWPNEACGFVLRIGKKSVAVEVENRSAEPTHTFLISAEDYAAAADQGEVIGIWHTHAEAAAVPSMADLAGCEATDLPWFLMSCNKSDDGFVLSELVRFDPDGFEAPYEGRPYAFGALDCWTLAQDYYRREFGIQLCGFPRIEEFWKKDGSNFMGDEWEKPGFVNCPRGTPAEIGDLFLFQTDGSGNPNHVGIYVGDNRILHHSRGRLSSSDPYVGYWQKHTVRHIRHKDKVTQ